MPEQLSPNANGNKLGTENCVKLSGRGENRNKGMTKSGIGSGLNGEVQNELSKTQTG